MLRCYHLSTSIGQTAWSERLMEFGVVGGVVFDLTWNPPWTPARLTEAGRRALGLDAP